MSLAGSSVVRMTLLAALGLVIAAALGLATTSVTSQTVGLSGEDASVHDELVAGDSTAPGNQGDGVRPDGPRSGEGGGSDDEEPGGGDSASDDSVSGGSDSDGPGSDDSDSDD